MTSDFSDAAAMWNKRFAGEDYLFGREPNEYLRSRVNELPPGGNVLCVADGEGRNSVWLAAQGLRAEAFDISEIGVAKAGLLAAQYRVRVDFHVADCDAWAWSAEQYDGIVAVFVQFADPQMRERLFAHIVAALKPSGVVILQGYTPKQLEYNAGGPATLSHLYTEDVLRIPLLLFEVIEIVEYEAEMSEGTRHTGRSALIGLTARKPR